MKFTQIPTDTFATIQLNAGILLKGAEAFNPATGQITASAIMGATSGGVQATCTPEYTDFGENIDNCPKNTKELKNLDNWTCTIGGTFVTVSVSLAKMMLGAADIDENDATKIVPRVDLLQSDFIDVWFVGDYSDKNGNTNGGFVAIHLLNALSTGGFSMQSGDKEKGQFEVEFTGHVSMSAQEVVPMEFFIKAGTSETGPVYTYTVAELTNGFVYGVTYYTRSGEEGSYVYTEVPANSTYNSETTYYTRTEGA